MKLMFIGGEWAAGVDEVAIPVISQHHGRLPLEHGRFRTDAINASVTDCVAGHIGFEPANPSASYLIGIS